MSYILFIYTCSYGYLASTLQLYDYKIIDLIFIVESKSIVNIKLIPTANTCVDALALRGRQAYFSLSILNVINTSINLLIDKDLRGLFSSIVFYLPFLIKKKSLLCRFYFIFFFSNTLNWFFYQPKERDNEFAYENHQQIVMAIDQHPICTMIEQTIIR
jgi:hypothetical protein